MAICLIFSALSLSAQETVEEKISALFESNDYNTIIEEYAPMEIDLSAEALYYIGRSHMVNRNDSECVRYMNLSIAKDSSNPVSHYAKALSLIGLGREKDAVPSFKKAISLESDSIRLLQSYISLGYTYYSMKEHDLALETYNKAKAYGKTAPTAYIMIAQIYFDLKQTENALKACYEGKENINKETDEYISILFEIGSMEQSNGNFEAAENAYNELLRLWPEDYTTYSRLIQIHYHNKEYDKAEPLKAVLYEAHKNELLEKSVSEMFCMDQFECGDQKVLVFERFEEGDKSLIYDKIRFYILDKNGEVEYRIQTEYSPAMVAFEQGKYMLCGWKDGGRVNYGIVFDDSTSYDTIKNAVIAILEEKIPPQIKVEVEEHEK